MRTITKRIMAMVLALCLCWTLLPTVAVRVNAAYENTHTNSGDQALDIVAVAQTQVGYQEGPNNDNKYGAAFGHNNVAWCAYFISWCAKEAGISDSIIHRQGIASPFSDYFNVPNTHGSDAYFPKPGDLVFYGPNSNGDHYHVGIVETVNPSTGYITTIEGNTNSNGSSEGYIVYRHTRHYQHSTICCYGTPNYEMTTAPEKPTITTTTAYYAEGSDISISWNAVAGNSFYWINVYKDGSLIVDQSMDNATSYTLYNAAAGEYQVFVSANNSAGTSGSSAYSFSVIQKIQRSIDDRYASYFPIGAYPISTGHIGVYDATGTMYSNRYIDGATDICIILEIYTDGWCKVRYPSSVEESGHFDAYVPLSIFTTASAPSSWTATKNYTTYMRSDLGSTMYSVSSGATCLLLETNDSVKQIIHPVDGQEYSMMGWISDPRLMTIEVASLPTKTTYYVGDILDTTGLSLLVTYSNGNSETISSGFSCSPTVFNTAGTQTVTVTFGDSSTTFTVMVEENEAFDPTVPHIVVETATAVAGDTVTITISIANNPGFGGMAFDVFYDNIVLELVSYELGLGSSICVDSGVGTYENKVNFQYAGTTNITGDGTLVTFTFKVLESAEIGLSAINVIIEEGTVFRYDGRTEIDFDLAAINGGVEVIDYLKGDINGDGKVNNRDVARLMQYLAGWDVEYVVAALDVNGDGKVNNRDAARLQQYLAGWDVEIY